MKIKTLKPDLSDLDDRDALTMLVPVRDAYGITSLTRYEYLFDPSPAEHGVLKAAVAMIPPELALSLHGTNGPVTVMYLAQTQRPVPKR